MLKYVDSDLHSDSFVPHHGLGYSLTYGYACEEVDRKEKNPTRESPLTKLLRMGFIR